MLNIFQVIKMGDYNLSAEEANLAKVWCHGFVNELLDYWCFLL